jgi:Peptidase M15
MSKSTLIRVPGISKAVDLDQPISIDAPSFTWREATRDGTRLPWNDHITHNIIITAEHMQKVRKYTGALIVTSWLRPPRVNAAVGGAKRSTHMLGAAVDFRSWDGRMSNDAIYRYLLKTFPSNGIARKFPTSTQKGFVHSDIAWATDGWPKGRRWIYR